MAPNRSFRDHLGGKSLKTYTHYKGNMIKLNTMRIQIGKAAESRVKSHIWTKIANKVSNYRELKFCWIYLLMGSLLRGKNGSLKSSFDTPGT